MEHPTDGIPPHQDPGEPVSRNGSVGVLLALLAGTGVFAVWWFFVTTSTGQHLDQVAYEGSRIGRGRLSEYAHSLLQVVSVPFLVVVIAACTTVAALRRHWALAVGVAVMVGAANVTTQVLKYQVLSRPDLGISEVQPNSLPSGHTTVAASVAAAALLVCPPSWRWLVAPLGAGYTGATGLATMIGGWHRASDVAAAVLVVAAWLLLAQALLGGGRPSRAATDTLATVRTLGTVGVGAAVAALLSLVATARVTDPDRSASLVAYGGASLGILAVICLTTLAALLTATEAPDAHADRAGA